MKGLVDTHCHIHAAVKGRMDFTARKWQDADETDPDTIINAAVGAGVDRLICVGTDFDDSQDAVAFVQNRKNCWAAVGVHPHDAQNFFEKHQDLSMFEKLTARPKVVAIGEVGLDYYYEHSPREQQLRLLEMFLTLAAAKGLPMIFHVRDAFDDFWPVFDKFKNIKGVLHSFTATQEVLDKALSRGLYIGLNGIMTFTKQHEQLEMAKAVPLDRLLVETDAPYLAPKPFRGKICKPEHAKATAEFLCQLRAEKFEDLSVRTSENASFLFRIGP